MKPETTIMMLLVWSVALTFVQMLISVSGATLQIGLPRLAGNREKMPELTGWVGRASRAHANMIENLVLFAALVLAVVTMGKVNESAIMGAQIFFWARAAYAVIYLIGVPWLRTGAWVVSVVGLLMIFQQVI